MTATKVVILYGSLRPGTTLFRIMLNGHPRLYCPSEADFLSDFISPTADDGWSYYREALTAHRVYKASLCRIPGRLDGQDALRAMIGQIARNDRVPVLVATATWNGSPSFFRRHRSFA